MIDIILDALIQGAGIFRTVLRLVGLLLLMSGLMVGAYLLLTVLF